MLLIGLKNPGDEYKNTYHNVGGDCIDYLATHLCEEHNSPYWKKERHMEWTQCGSYTLAKSLTYMNHSGNAVREAIKHAKTSHDMIIIIHDDSDLFVGKFKLSRGSGAAGHKGVENIIATLGTKEFTRARIGIRPKPFLGHRQKAEKFVLKSIKRRHRAMMENTYAAILSQIQETKH
jgi:peptidyl-tRNA hydrolase, PTH1 family